MRTLSGHSARLFAFLVPVLFAAGCSSNSSYFQSPVVAAKNPVLEGHVHGGQQAVVGATIQLYAAGMPTTGGGYGLGSVPLITGTLPTTDLNGNFTITGTYTLPTTPSYLYIVATGGTPGVGVALNSKIAMMSVLQGCTGVTALSPNLFININEVTTEASVLALSQFMAPPAAGNTMAPAIGGPATAAVQLADAFATANNIASIGTGTSLTHLQDYAASDANALMVNTLADILSYCVNSTPTTGNQCSTLFTNTTPSNATFVAADTIQSALYTALNPAYNVPAIYNLAAASAPFVGLTSPPPSFLVSVLTAPSACQTPVPLGSAGNYAVLAGTTVTNQSTASDKTVVTGGLVGVSPGTALTGFAGGTYTATLDNSGAAAAEGSLTAAYNQAAGLLQAAVLPQDMSNITFTPGLYKTGSAVTLNSGAVYLDGQGDPNATFVFQIGTTFTAAAGTQVILVNGASAKNIFWQVGSSATINGGAAWAGNVIAYTSISLGTDATLLGRAMASNGAVTLLSNKITVP
jgi:hypothetical protein